MTNEQKQKIKDYQREYKRNMSDKQKQRYKENKHNKDISDKKQDNNHFNDVIKL